MAEDFATEEGLPVLLPSGAEWVVLTNDEVVYVTERVTRYTTDNKFVNIADLQDVDRMIQMETLCHRWATYLSKGTDYFNDKVDEAQVGRRLGEYSSELRQLKKILGIDKAARERESGSDSVPAYLENLRRRAKEFGINRERMLDKGLELSQQLIGLLTLHDNADETERRELKITTEDLLEWVRTIFKPEFQAVDAHFRDKSQKYWIREQ